MKLTAAQFETLVLLERSTTILRKDTDRPMRRLVEIGLAENVGRWIGAHHHFSITDAGRAALASHE